MYNFTKNIAEEQYLNEELDEYVEMIDINEIQKYIPVLKTEDKDKSLEDLIHLAETTGIIGDKPIKLWERNKIVAHLDIENKEYKLRTNEIKSSLGDKKEFKIQINELLDQGLIRTSNSPHRLAAFMVRNRAEINRNKARMVINYKRLNDNTIDDGYKIPFKDMLMQKSFQNLIANLGSSKLRCDPAVNTGRHSHVQKDTLNGK